MRPKVEWRVVSTEKDLPRSDHPVLVTYKHRGRRYIDIAVTTPKFIRLGEGSWWDSVWDGNIIAWAELPEAYLGKLK